LSLITPPKVIGWTDFVRLFVIAEGYRTNRSSSWLLPSLAIPVNTLVMSPGGYRYSDYLKQGVPLCLIVLVVSVILLPLIFPF